MRLLVGTLQGVGLLGKMKQRILKRNGGFSLLETILTTTVLGVGLIAGMITLQNATLNTVNGDMATVATQLANEKIDSIMADKQYLGFSHLDAEDNYPTEQLSGAYAGFTRDVTIVEVNKEDLTTPEANTGVKKIQVIVGWGNKPDQTVHVSTLVADYM